MLNVVSQHTSVVHDSSHVEHDGSDLADGQLELGVGLHENVDESQIAAGAQELLTNEVDGPEVTPSASILKYGLTLQGELQCCYFLIGERLHSSHIGERLRSAVTHIGLGVLVSNGKLVKVVCTDTGHKDLRNNHSDDDKSDPHIVSKEDREGANDDAKRFAEHRHVFGAICLKS